MIRKRREMWREPSLHLLYLDIVRKLPNHEVSTPIYITTLFPYRTKQSSTTSRALSVLGPGDKLFTPDRTG